MATAYPGGLRKRGGLLDEFMAPDYSYLARRADPTPAQNTRGLVDYLRDEYPRIYGAGAGLLQSDPYETANAYGVFDPNRKAAFEAAQLAFPVGLALDVIPGVGALKRPVMAAGRFVAPKAGLLAEEYMVKTGGILPLDVYHGSPHIFPPTPKNPLGEFDASKIGTGEGAQAYGHGIYVAEAPGVATDYAKKLGPSTAMQSSQDIRERMGRFADAIAQRYKPDAISPIQDVLLNPDKYPQRVVNATKKISEAEDAAYLKATKGNLYKVDLPDKKIARMLDWDKPLSDQPEFVKNTLIYDMGVDDNWSSISGDSSGGALYDAMLKEYGSPEALSAALMNQGIPGIKYLDATSRSAGKGTRNFVVFPGEEKSMTILERNGQRATEELKRLQAGGLLAP